MARRCQLTGQDLARPAKELPLKTIKTLGYLLHTQLHNSGNWETVAEDLGYGYEAIKQFSTNANVHQDYTPGEIMLRDWIGRGTGRTLFVLRNALHSSDRHDCVEYLDQEINDKILHMELHVCISDISGDSVDHQPIRTKTHASLRDSLQNILDGPISNYQLADRGVSWDSTVAREYKGRELKIFRLKPSAVIVVNQEQDPTVDSSCPSLDVNTVEMGRETVDNELDRSTTVERRPSNSQVLNIPITAEKENNLANNHVGSELSQHCFSCTCQAGSQSPANIIRKSRTIYDDQDLTMQELRQIQRPGTAKIGTSSSVTAPDSATFQKEADCVRHLNTMGEQIDVSNKQSSSSVSAPDSATFQKEADWVKHSNTIGEQTDISNNQSVTYKKEIEEIVEERDPTALKMAKTPMSFGHFQCNRVEDLCQINFNDIYSRESESHKGSYKDSLTRQKEFISHQFESQKQLVDYTPSSSSTESEKASLDQTVMKSEYFNSADAGDDIHRHVDQLAKDRECFVYSYALASSADGESRNKQEKNPTDVGSVKPDSHMECHFTGDYMGSYIDNTSNEINFINTDSMEDDNYQSECWGNIDVLQTVHLEEIGSFPSKMDCQTLEEISDTGSCPDRNTQSRSSSFVTFDDIAHRQSSDFMQNEEDGSKVVGLNVNSMEMGDGIYSQQNENMHSNSADNHGVSESDLAGLVDDTAIVVDVDTINGEANKAKMVEIYASSVVPEVEEDRTRPLIGPTNCGTNQKPCSISKDNAKKYPYESLQRFISCPNDFGYEEPSRHIAFQKVVEQAEMSTIADAFTPTTEQLAINNFLIERKNRNGKSGDESNCMAPKTVNSLDRGNKTRTAIQIESTPNRKSCSDAMINRVMDRRMGLFPNNNSKQNNRPLPPPPPCTGHDQSGSPRRSPPQLPPRVSKISPHPYKLVSAGKSSRPMLDNLLSNDKLFMHYNACLQGYPGWSPRETEYTVEKTLKSVVHSDGYYLLWYVRSRKRLALSISHMGKVIHYEVRTKLEDGTLSYYIFPDTVHQDIRLLLQYHESHGLRPQTEQQEAGSEFISSQNSRDSRRFARYSHVFMRCPVLVEYGPRLAFSI